MHALYHPVTALMREIGSEIILPRFQTLATHEISEKTPGDLVTIADRDSEERLTDRLPRLLPGSRVIGEEAVSADPGLLDSIRDGLVWIVDPLDGTLNFAEGIKPFAIMIGLLEDGERIAGWILDPNSGRICHAVRGGGAFVDGKPVFARQTGGSLPLGAIAPYFLPPEQKAELERRAQGKIEVVAIPRCAGEQYPRLFLGQNDIALFERAHPWDHAPGSLMLEEAGGKIARQDGSPYQIGVPGPRLIAAVSPEIWEHARKTLAD